MSNLSNFSNDDLTENDVDYGANRKYKDSLFRLLFGREENKTNLLDLYNALNNSNYTNIDDLTINTIDDVIYMKMKNDVSFILDDQMVLLEHQSTYNPNMPLRGLLYFARLYEGMINISKNIYYPKLIKIPTPQDIVLYNGTDKKINDKKVLKLSEAFEKKDITNSYEWTATMIDINYGKNQDLLLKCKKLGEYSYFVDCVRKHSAKKSFPKAIDEAVKECIEKGILADFLKKHIAEVRTVLLTEYDEEKDLKIIAEGYKELWKEEGLEEGRKEGIKEGIKEGKENLIKAMLSNGKTKKEIIDFIGISEEEFNQIMKHQ